MGSPKQPNTFSRLPSTIRQAIHKTRTAFHLICWPKRDPSSLHESNKLSYTVRSAVWAKTCHTRGGTPSSVTTRETGHRRFLTGRSSPFGNLQPQATDGDNTDGEKFGVEDKPPINSFQHWYQNNAIYGVVSTIPTAKNTDQRTPTLPQPFHSFFYPFPASLCQRQTLTNRVIDRPTKQAKRASTIKSL